eukprot:13171756-Alexandrium_andersonii.AAC.1
MKSQGVPLTLADAPLTITRHSPGTRYTHMPLTTHALTPFNLDQQLFFLSRPDWPSSLSLARANPCARASHTAPGA